MKEEISNLGENMIISVGKLQVDSEGNIIVNGDLKEPQTN